MPVALKTRLAPLKALASKYITSHKARVQAQREAAGTTSGPTGAEVDANVASTLTRSQGAALLAQQEQLHDIPQVQTDDQGRTLGLEDPNDPALQDDPHMHLHATAQPTNIVPVTAETDPELLKEVSEVTYGLQNSIPLFPSPTEERGEGVNQYGFIDPRLFGGTSFDLVGDGLHEPLNVIISSLASPTILTKKGLQSYLRSLDFDRECLGLHAGGYQKAWVDSRGWRDQEFIYRQVLTPIDYVFGTCVESLLGGNHVRAWQQEGSAAWFIAASREEDASKGHMIVPNGYNVGRNQLVQKALGVKKDGKTSFMGREYRTRVEFVAGLMPQGNLGVNHDISVDGLTAVLTVEVLDGTNWFGLKEAVVPSGMMAAKEEEGPKRRRFSIRRNSKQQEDSVWSKLKGLAAPKHTAKAKSGGEVTNDTLVATTVGEEAHEGPSSMDSASTAAEAVPVQDSKTQQLPVESVVAPAVAA